MKLRTGDIWEEKICDWGHWEPEVYSRWEWNGKKWERID